MDSDAEEARLAALRSYQVLDRPRPATLDALTGLAAVLFETPLSAVSLIDRDRQWFAGSTGLADRQTPLSVSFCVHTLTDKQLLVVPDARLDHRFSAYPNVREGPRIRFYAGAPIVDEDGFALGALCVVDDRPRDPSDRLLDQLTALAGQAAGHLALIRSRLRLADLGDELARAEQREEDLVASITHELRTPVTSIQGYLELLADSGDPGLAAEFMEPIQRNGDRLVAVVNHLIAGTRSDATALPVVLAPMDLGAIADAATRACASLAEAHGVTLRLTDGEPVPLEADAALLTRAVEQLVRNAVLFTPPGGHVTVDVPGGPVAGVTVTDDGVGVPPDELPYVFDRFYRGRYAREQAVPGVGLGLALARQLVGAHGGELHLTSSGGVTTAGLVLPAATPDGSRRPRR
ncbi:sensor histidine kinase [Cryptosporangium arvum]|uniref:sensor histidine kinase n=1 Tax=Cryptosporangium arvum TaxID=80871 RepID=UPI0004B3CBBB|nr:HAMP domain-containing sensor histidine kinase [Cryptosporangium arvum]